MENEHLCPGSGLSHHPSSKPTFLPFLNGEVPVQRSSGLPVSRFIFMGNQPFSVNGECNGEGSWGCRIMDPEAAKSSRNLAMENARNLGTFDCFPKYICLISNGITVAACLPCYLYSPTSSVSQEAKEKKFGTRVRSCVLPQLLNYNYQPPKATNGQWKWTIKKARIDLALSE